MGDLSRLARGVRGILVIVLAMLASVAVGCGSDGGSEDPPSVAPGVGIARIEISPPGGLVTPGRPLTFRARAVDAAGKEVPGSVQWTSNEPASIAIDSAGRATAAQALGSALVTAEIGGVRASVIAVAAETAPGAILLDDDQISALPTPIDPNARLAVGFRYRVDLVSGVTPPPVGAVVIGTGGKPVAGRVVISEATNITVEQLTLKQIFPRLSIRQTINLDEAGTAPGPIATQSSQPRGVSPLIEKDFKVGPVACTVEGEAGAFELEKKDFALSASGLQYELAWNDTEKKIVVRGSPKVTFEVEPVLKGQISGKITCKVILREVQIPLPGPLGIFLGAAIPMGLGFELGATASITRAGVNLKGSARGDMAFGFRCDGNGQSCSAVTEVASNGELVPTLIPPELSLADAHFDPTVRVFAFATLEGGGRFSSTLRAEAIEAELGFKLEGSLATEETQAKSKDYASSYKLALLGTAGPAGALESFLGLVEIAVSILQFERSIPIGESPAATSVRGAPANFKTGDTVTFDVALDPAKLRLPVVDYNIASVRIYRVERRPDGSIVLVLANEVTPAVGAANVQIPWVATLDGSVGGNFVAFVKTKLSDLRFDLGEVTASGAQGTFIANGGGTATATDGYSFLVPPNDPDFGTTTKSLAVGKFFYSDKPEGVLTCAAQTQKGSSAKLEVAFAHDDAIVPGTYTFAPLDAVTSGTFTALLTGLGAGCSTTTAEFRSGQLILTEGTATKFKGTFRLNTGAGADSTGTFEIPACVKTFSEHKNLNLLCQAP